MECKFARDFQSADEIQSTLESSGVDVHDGFKEWRADGEQWGRSNRRDGGRGGGGGGYGAPKVYSQRGPGKGLTTEQIETIEGMVSERSEAKAVGDYNRADEIFDSLATDYNVNVDDKNSEWALLNEEYLLDVEGTSLVPDEGVQSAIGKKLGERVLARKARDFDLADNIRDELRREYVVEIDDRSKEWVVVAPEGGEWADDEADGDFVSKEEWDDEDNEDEDFEEEEKLMRIMRTIC